MDDYDETAPRTKAQTGSRGESASSQRSSQRSSVSLQSPYTSSVDCNDTESGFESGSSSTTTTTTVTSWRRQRQSPHPHEDGLTDLKNLTVRSTWKTRGVSSGEDSAPGRGDARAATDCVFEDDAENSAMWRAYRATTTDAEEMLNSGKNPDAQKAAKPSPAEVRWMNHNVALTEISVLAVCYSCFCLPFVPGVHAENQQCYKCKRAGGTRVSARKTLPVSLRGGRGLRKSDTPRTRHVSVLGTITHTTTGTAQLPLLHKCAC